MEIKMNMPEPPKGFEYTGEYRLVNVGEWASVGTGSPYQYTSNDSIYPYPIIRKKALIGEAWIDSLKPGTTVTDHQGSTYFIVSPSVGAKEAVLLSGSHVQIYHSMFNQDCAENCTIVEPK